MVCEFGVSDGRGQPELPFHSCAEYVNLPAVGTNNPYRHIVVNIAEVLIEGAGIQ